MAITYYIMSFWQCKVHLFYESGCEIYRHFFYHVPLKKILRRLSTASSLDESKNIHLFVDVAIEVAHAQHLVLSGNTGGTVIQMADT